MTPPRSKKLLWAAALSCVAAVSCARSIRNPFSPWTTPAPTVLTQGASLEAVTTAVNQNAAKIHSLKTDDASITVPGMPGVPILRGNIAAVRPDKLRLQASTALTGAEVDLGSSGEIFWSWVKRSEPPALYFVRRDQLASSAAGQLLPVEPSWLLDALGLAQINPAEVRQGPTAVDRSRLELVSVASTPRGPVTKRTIVDAQRAWILEQYVYSQTGELLASSVARSHRYYPEAGVSLPQELEIRVPSAELSLTISLGTVQINQLADVPQLWTMPTIPGTPTVDLGAAGTLPGAAPPLGEQISRADWNAAPQQAGPPLIDGPPPFPEASGTPYTGAPVVASPAPVTPGQNSPAGVVGQLPPGGTPLDGGFVR